jgi:hypothetical protein
LYNCLHLCRSNRQHRWNSQNRVHMRDRWYR